jgi:hypothetical protein
MAKKKTAYGNSNLCISGRDLLDGHHERQDTVVSEEEFIPFKSFEQRVVQKCDLK